ncbi:MAG: hypothetical protein AAF384_15205 [Pseudomonadota bacterium]
MNNDLAPAFVSWQCRIRQHAARRNDGRPSSGMQPTASIDDRVIASFVSLLVPNQPTDNITHLKYLHKKTFDPRERYQAILKLLCGTYFQNPAEFSDCLLAIFNKNSKTAAHLRRENSCLLSFEQFGQHWRFSCAVHAEKPESPAYQAAFWYSAMFNPALHDEIEILRFAPDWQTAEAVPPIP